MTSAILIQAHEKIQQATIEAIGEVDAMLRLKEEAEKTLEMTTADLPVLARTRIIKPKFHLLILDDRLALKIGLNFELHDPQEDIWNILLDPSLAEHY